MTTTINRGSKADIDDTEASYVGVVIAATAVFTGLIRYDPTTMTNMVIINPVSNFIYF